ncbi:MAG: methyl-accepting chemotaxis protein [Lachnospiraceae bacterium]|nr:methyl-accepting chemotaxis protein [Lachnospiraceae bacterium]
MKFKQKMLTLCCIPLLFLTVLSLIIGLVQFRSGMYAQTKSRLKSGALAAMSLYTSQGYGDYDLKADGNVWRGMNFNVSQESSVVDDLKEQTGIDITFFYQDTAAMTSVCSEDGKRWNGMKAGENIKKYTLEQGAQLWYRNIEIDKRMCHAYIIPIVQPDSGRVAGALMASVSADEMDKMMNQYILTSALVSAVILLAVVVFIFWYIGGLTKIIYNVRHVLLKVSEGELSDDRLAGIKWKDEFGELAAGTEKLRMKIGNLLSNIQDGMDRLSVAAEKLSDMLKQNIFAAREMNGSIGQINGKANSQKTAVQHALRDVDVTRDAIDLILQQIGDINYLSEHMAALSGNSQDIMDGLSESSRNSRETVREISIQAAITNESVQQIKSVTEYITNIAEETNLLALNASIEAARAGTAGKGFAVVALEIQKLAEESNNSAVRIGDNIQALVCQMDGIVKVMGTIEEALKYQEENVDKTKLIFGEINQAIVQITEKEAAMQDNVSDMNCARDNMSEVISDLSASAVDNADLSQSAAEVTEQMMCGIENLEVLTTDLTDLANQLGETLQAFLA